MLHFMRREGFSAHKAIGMSALSGIRMQRIPGKQLWISIHPEQGCIGIAPHYPPRLRHRYYLCHVKRQLRVRVPPDLPPCNTPSSQDPAAEPERRRPSGAAVTCVAGLPPGPASLTALAAQVAEGMARRGGAARAAQSTLRRGRGRGSVGHIVSRGSARCGSAAHGRRHSGGCPCSRHRWNLCGSGRRPGREGK